jgi:hypothetical protein
VSIFTSLQRHLDGTASSVGAGDGEAWTATVYWTGEEWSDHPSLACSRSRFGFRTEEEARVWLEKQPD